MPKLGGGHLHFSRSFRDGKTARAFQTRKGRELNVSVTALAPITFAGFLLDYIAPHLETLLESTARQFEASIKRFNESVKPNRNMRTGQPARLGRRLLDRRRGGH